MSKISEMTRDSWIKSTFPEWGTWLVEDIENEVVAPGNVAMWWLGCTGVWFKTPADTNITIDLWCGNGKRTHGDNKMKPGHQMANMCGGRLMQPNLRNVPFVIDPFAFKHVDAVLATHYHQDHMSAEWAAHVIQSGMTLYTRRGSCFTQLPSFRTLCFLHIYNSKSVRSDMGTDGCANLQPAHGFNSMIF